MADGKKMADETMFIKFTEKGLALSKEIKSKYDEWLKGSDMTQADLLKYKDVKGFHIHDDDVGSFLAYYKKGELKQIGAGLYKEQLIEAQWIFGYACCILDNKNNYKSDFAKEFLKWGAKYE